MTTADILRAEGQREMLLKQIGKRFGVLRYRDLVRTLRNRAINEQQARPKSLRGGVALSGPP
jgi:hypothetical protein